jgi:hypothetical protein
MDLGVDADRVRRVSALERDDPAPPVNDPAAVLFWNLAARLRWVLLKTVMPSAQPAR